MPGARRRGSQDVRRSERVLAIHDPAALIFDDELHLGSEWNREIRILVARGEIHQHGNVDIGNEVEKEILELVFLRAIERELTEDDSRHFLEESGGAEVHESFIDDRHRVARLFDEENCSLHVDLVRRADRLLHEREIPADEPSGRASRLDGARQLASDRLEWTGCRERGDERRRRGIAQTRNQIVDRGAVKAPQVRAPHEPQVQRGDVRIADERLRVVVEDGRIEMWQEAHGAIAASARDDRVDLRIEPHAHEAFGASLIFGARESRKALDVRIELHDEAGALQGANTTRQPPELWRVRGRDDANGVALHDCRRSQ